MLTKALCNKFLVLHRDLGIGDFAGCIINLVEMEFLV